MSAYHSVPAPGPGHKPYGHYLDDAAASYIRIAAVSIAAYDYVMTLPAEWRFYKTQKSWRLSPGCILFILIRYVSMVVLTLSTVGFFAEFSPGMCRRYFLLAPIFKLLQSMVSQVILGIRTLNISGRSRVIAWILLFVFAIVTVAEWFTNLYNVGYIQDRHKNCQAAEYTGHYNVWLFYVVAMFYDVVTLSISTFYLLRFTPPSGRMSRLVKLMFVDGIGFFVILTGVNVLNLVLFRTSDSLTQASGACLGEAVTWIMSQRILIHLRDAAADHHRTAHVVSRPLHSARSISHVMRTQFESKERLDEEFGLSSTPPADGQSLTDLVRNLSDIELDVQVQVEHSVTVEVKSDPDAYQRESYRNPRVLWSGNATPRANEDSPR